VAVGVVVEGGTILAVVSLRGEVAVSVGAVEKVVVATVSGDLHPVHIPNKSIETRKTGGFMGFPGNN